MMRTIAGRAASVTSALLLAAAPVAAQGVGADTAVQGYAPGEVSTSSETAKHQANPMRVVGSVVLAPRSEAYLEQAIEAADRTLNRADADLGSAAERRKQAEDLVRKRELRLSQIDAAKHQKPELPKPRRDSLEAEEQALKRRLPLTKDAVALANVEMDVAGAAREAAIAEQQALESERMLVRKRAESDGDTESVLSLARETLVAQKKSANLAERLASKRALLASKRLDLYRAYLDLRKREGN
jgi:hypothetical protein